MIEADDRQNARLHDLQHQNAHAHQEETREELHLLCHRRLASKLNTAHTMAHRVPPASERRIRRTADAAFRGLVSRLSSGRRVRPWRLGCLECRCLRRTMIMPG